MSVSASEDRSHMKLKIASCLLFLRIRMLHFHICILILKRSNRISIAESLESRILNWFALASASVRSTRRPFTSCCICRWNLSTSCVWSQFVIFLGQPCISCLLVSFKISCTRSSWGSFVTFQLVCRRFHSTGHVRHSQATKRV